MSESQVKRTKDGRFQKGFSASPDKIITKDKQPPAKNKSQGRKRQIKKKKQAEFTRELIKDLLARKYKFSKDSITKTDGIGKNLVEAFGKDVLNKSAGEVAVLVALNRAILTRDTTNLFNLLNQAFGLPKQELGITDKDGNDRNLNDLSQLTDDELRSIIKGKSRNNSKAKSC